VRGLYKDPMQDAIAWRRRWVPFHGDLRAGTRRGRTHRRRRALKDMLKVGGENVAALEDRGWGGDFLGHATGVKLRRRGITDDRVMEVPAARPS